VTFCERGAGAVWSMRMYSWVQISKHNFITLKPHRLFQRIMIFYARVKFYIDSGADFMGLEHPIFEQ